MVLARPSLLAATVVAMLATSTAGFQLTVQNGCAHTVELYTRQGEKYGDEKTTVASGASHKREIAKGFEGHFRHGSDDAATLVEFATKGDLPLAWFDISIIPPRLNKGFEFCTSLAECKANSQSGKGFNVPVQITPLSNTNGANCREISCLADGCTDAYQFPKDDIKTHSCPFATTDFKVTFCPGGSAEAEETPAPTSTPKATTKAPESTPKATTKAPAKDEGAGKVVPSDYDSDDELAREAVSEPKAPVAVETPGPKAVNPAAQLMTTTTAPPKVVLPPATPATPTKAAVTPTVAPTVAPTADKPKVAKPKRCLP